VNDAVSATNFTNDIDNQNAANYKYDKTGNLIEDVSESIRIHWTYYNKVKQIDSVKLTPPKYGLVWATKLRMKYDALGNRVVKENPKRKVKEVYVRDAQGNILALYQVKNDSLYTKEFYMYGSQRLGYFEDEVFMGRKCIGKFCNIVAPTLPLLPSVASKSVSVVFGKKRYELSDWLGNVRVVINDRKTPINSGNATVGYKAQVMSVSDYYSFGSTIKERTYNFTYRFGYNAGSEIDRGVYSQSDRVFNTFHREGDTYLARWWSVDPEFKKMPWQTPYSLMDNDPIRHNDPKGDQIDVIVDLGFIGYDLYDIGRSLIKGEGTKKEQWIALGLDVAGALIPFATGLGAAYKATSSATKVGTKLALHTAVEATAKSAQIGEKIIIREGTGKGVAVVGRSMEGRVKPFAEKLSKELGENVEIFDPAKYAKEKGIKYEENFEEWVDKIKNERQISSYEEIPVSEYLKTQTGKLNKMWMEEKLAEGKTIVDIGVPKGMKPGPAVKMEQDIIKNYGKSVKEMNTKK
jgi:hypothetical protein